MSTTVVYSTTGDGAIDADQTQAATWAGVHDATSGNSPSTGGTTLRPATNFSGGNYRIDRAFLYFPDPSLGTDTVTAVDIDLYNTGSNGNADSTYISMVTSTQSTPLVAGDYDLCGNIDSPTKITSDINIASLTSSAYNTFTGTAGYISALNKNAVNLVGVRNGIDLDTTGSHTNAPTGQSDAIFSSADETGTTQDPKMTITHNAAITFDVSDTISVGEAHTEDMDVAVSDTITLSESITVAKAISFLVQDTINIAENLLGAIQAKVSSAISIAENAVVTVYLKWRNSVKPSAATLTNDTKPSAATLTNNTKPSAGTWTNDSKPT